MFPTFPQRLYQLELPAKQENIYVIAHHNRTLMFQTNHTSREKCPLVLIVVQRITGTFQDWISRFRSCVGDFLLIPFIYGSLRVWVTSIDEFEQYKKVSIQSLLLSKIIFLTIIFYLFGLIYSSFCLSLPPFFCGLSFIVSLELIWIDDMGATELIFFNLLIVTLENVVIFFDFKVELRCPLYQILAGVCF